MGPSEIKLQQKLGMASQLACEYKEPKISPKAQEMRLLWAYENGSLDWESVISVKMGNIQAMSSPIKRAWKWDFKLDIERLVAKL